MTEKDITFFIKRNIGSPEKYHNFIGSNKYVQCAYLYFYKKHKYRNIERCVKMFTEAFSVKNWKKYESIGLDIGKKSGKLIFSTNEAIFEGLIDSFIIKKRKVLRNE